MLRKKVKYSDKVKNKRKIQAEYKALKEANPSIYNELSEYLKYSTEVNILLFKLGLKVKKKRFRKPKSIIEQYSWLPDELFYNGIIPLLKRDPTLAEAKNTEVLKLLIKLGTKAVEYNFGTESLFSGLTYLQYRVKDIEVLKLLVERSIKEMNNKTFDLKYLTSIIRHYLL